MTPDAIRLLLCDDHAVVREGLARLLDGVEGIAIVGSAADGEEGVAEARRLQPDVVLMDLSMPRLDGIAATRRIVADVPGVHVLVLTSFAEADRVQAAIDAGASGYVLKDAEPSELVSAVRAASKGHAPLDPRAARALLDAQRAVHPGAQLTRREREVLELVGGGLSNKVIALRLGISDATVKAHLTRIYQVLNVTDRTQAALWLVEHGMPGGSGRDR